MTLFTIEEYGAKYGEQISINRVEEASEMIFAQCSSLLRDRNWNDQTVPQSVKNACMEQARFLEEQDIPHVDTKKIKAGNMEADLQSEYSTLALTMLGNAGYLYRGSEPNFSIDVMFGE
jgi:hypothetical protein